MKFTSDPQITKGKVLRIVFPTWLLALALLSATAPASAQSNAYADNFGNSASIEGTWIFNIDVLLAQQTIAAFNSLISFGGGGIVVTTPSTPPMSTFYGAWKCNKSDSCNAVFYSFALIPLAMFHCKG